MRSMHGARDLTDSARGDHAEGGEGKGRLNGYQQERTRRRVALGKCASCAGSPLVTKTHCARCRELAKASAQRRRDRLRFARLCIECGKASADAGLLKCAACRARAHTRFQKWRAEIAKTRAAAHLTKIKK
jgi:hypothetical protein